MLALPLTSSPNVAVRLPYLRSHLALIVGALAPWLLLVVLPGVLHGTAAACIAGSFPA